MGDSPAVDMARHLLTGAVLVYLILWPPAQKNVEGKENGPSAFQVQYSLPPLENVRELRGEAIDRLRDPARQMQLQTSIPGWDCSTLTWKRRFLRITEFAIPDLHHTFFVYSEGIMYISALLLCSTLL